MVNALIINTGSSTIKYRVYSNDKIILDGIIDNIKDYSEAAKKILSKINVKIDKVAYRVVYGIDYKNHVIINNEVLSKLKKTSSLAPVHMPNEIEVIEFFMKHIKAKHIACFDNIFFKDMPEVSKVYAIPERFTKKYNIQRYGFHGLAHQYMVGKAKGKVITCQLGNGASISAIKNGKPIDTSMGFTPLEGLVMGTRSGDIDPAIVSYLSKKENISAEKVIEILNKSSGLKGISGESDVRNLLKRKDKKARLALDLFIHSIKKFIGAYAAILGGVDYIIFGGGISHSKEIINRILKDLPFKPKIIILETDEQKVMHDISKIF